MSEKAQKHISILEKPIQKKRASSYTILSSRELAFVQDFYKNVKFFIIYSFKNKKESISH